MYNNAQNIWPSNVMVFHLFWLGTPTLFPYLSLAL